MVDQAAYGDKASVGHSTQAGSRTKSSNLAACPADDRDLRELCASEHHLGPVQLRGQERRAFQIRSVCPRVPGPMFLLDLMSDYRVYWVTNQEYTNRQLL